MAKSQTEILEEQKRREKEKEEREKEEQKEIEQKRKEKEKRKKKREKLRKKKTKEEKKRIRTLINFPFKVLNHVTLLLTTLSFIIIFFAFEVDIRTTLLYCFYIFTLLYLGVGSVMVAIYLLLAKDKEKELIEQMKRDEEEARLEEERRQEEELAKLEEIEKEISEKRLAEPSQTKELPESTGQMSMDDMGMQTDLPEQELPEEFGEVPQNMPDSMDDSMPGAGQEMEMPMGEEDMGMPEDKGTTEKDKPQPPKQQQSGDYDQDLFDELIAPSLDDDK